MEIPKYHVAKIFGMNIGQRTSELYLINGDAVNDVINDKIKPQILKKALYNMPIEDAKAIAKLCDEPFLKILHVKEENRVCISTTCTTNGDREDRTIYIGSDGTIVLLYNNGNWGGSGYKNINVVQIYQYLHELGYALSITLINETGEAVTYTVDDLVKAGIYKLS